jgi:hypothetical protein
VSAHDVPDFSNPIGFVTASMAATDLPDWVQGIAVIPGAGASVGSQPGWYGDAFNGSGTLDGTSTVFGFAPAGHVYKPTNVVFANNLTINSGVTLNLVGWHLFVSGTLTNNGVISANGNSTTTNTGGAAISSATGSSFNDIATISTAGGNGGTTAGGSNGVNLGNIGAITGQAGHGGAGSGGAGGIGGTSTNLTSTGIQPRALPWTILGWGYSALGTNQPLYGGCGGGGGGGSATGNGGGGGGGGGPMIILAATIAGTGVIQALGGNGANAVGGNGGGGGGGAGGVIILMSGSVSSGAVAGQTISVAGGSGGSGLGSGSAGATGGAGNLYLYAN